MAHHSIDLDVDAALAPPRACPSCRGTDLRPVCGEQGLVFLCPGCSRTWSWELGALLPAEPASGAGGPVVPVPRPGAPS